MLRQKSGTQKIRLFSFAAGFLLITLGALSVPFSYAKENTEITRPDETALYAEILSSFHGCRDALLKRIAGEKKKDKEIYAKAELLEYQFSKADGSFEKAFIFLEGLKTDAENSFANGTASEKLFALERIIAAFSDGAYSSVTVNEAAEKAFSFIPEQEKKDNGEENEKTGKNGFFKAFPEKELKQKNLTPIEDFITEDFGAIGTPEREQFDMECDAFIIGEQLKDERLRAGLTQEQLADKIGTKKSFISRVERGHTDIQLSTLVKLFQGLGRKVSVRVI